ncbi:hypothetical protein ACFS07_36415 [Undibacterium arcticum]
MTNLNQRSAANTTECENDQHEYALAVKAYLDGALEGGLAYLNSTFGAGPHYQQSCPLEVEFMWDEPEFKRIALIDLRTVFT